MAYEQWVFLIVPQLLWQETPFFKVMYEDACIRICFWGFGSEIINTCSSDLGQLQPGFKH